MADLIALLMVTLSGMLQPGVTESALEAELAAVVMREQPAPLDSVRVDASGVSAGGADTVEFRLDGLTMDALQVRHATFTIKGLKRTDAGKLSLGGITWRAQLDEAALTAALRAEGGSMKDAQVLLAPDGLTLKGKYPLGFTKVGYSVTGNLTVESETLLMFYIDKSSVSGVGVPKGINNKIEKDVNPVYDLAKFEARSSREIELARQQLDYDFELRVRSIAPKAGHIILAGTA